MTGVTTTGTGGGAAFSFSALLSPPQFERISAVMSNTPVVLPLRQYSLSDGASCLLEPVKSVIAFMRPPNVDSEQSSTKNRCPLNPPLTQRHAVNSQGFLSLTTLQLLPAAAGAACCAASFRYCLSSITPTPSQRTHA